MFIEKGRFFDLNNEFLVPTVQIQTKRSIGFNIHYSSICVENGRFSSCLVLLAVLSYHYLY